MANWLKFRREKKTAAHRREKNLEVISGRNPHNDLIDKTLMMVREAEGFGTNIFRTDEEIRHMNNNALNGLRAQLRQHIRAAIINKTLLLMDQAKLRRVTFSVDPKKMNQPELYAFLLELEELKMEVN